MELARPTSSKLRPTTAIVKKQKNNRINEVNTLLVLT